MRRSATAVLFAALSAPAGAVDHLVGNQAELTAALGGAAPGDRILIQPGTYQGGLFRSGLSGVTIRSLDPADPAVIQGGTNNIQLSDARDVVIEDLILEGAGGNGINIDDGGSFATPSQNVTLRNLIVRDVGTTGNQDGIKLSGVTGFHIDRVRVTQWGAGGSGIDMVGAHDGLIENSFFRHDALTGTGIRPKGGSKNITIRANRIELPNGAGRAIQFGGSTGSQFFRFIDGDSGYEADSIVAEGNVIVGGSAAYAYVNIDGGVFHHNYAVQPIDWVLRILNENQGLNIVDTRNGAFLDNVTLFDDGLRTTVNVGPETEPETFSFAGNTWYNVDTPAQSAPVLPVAESGAAIGVDPELDAGGVIAWSFDWGVWLVNANDGSHAIAPDALQGFLLATFGNDATFDPLATDPLQGAFTTAMIDSALTLEPFSQAVLLAQPVPLPAAAWLLLSGCIGLAAVRRRR